MKDSRKAKSLLQAGAVLLFCVFLAAACNDNSSKTTTSDSTATVVKTDTTMQVVKTDSMPPLSKDTDTKTRPETIKNGGTPPPPPPPGPNQ